MAFVRHHRGPDVEKMICDRIEHVTKGITSPIVPAIVTDDFVDLVLTPEGAHVRNHRDTTELREAHKSRNEKKKHDELGGI